MKNTYRLRNFASAFCAIALIVVSGCCDCDNPLETIPSAQQQICNIREASISKYSADANIFETVVGNRVIRRIEPQNDYSIHSFLFPTESGLSGRLVNEEAIHGGGEVVLYGVDFLCPEMTTPPGTAILGDRAFGGIFDTAPASSQLIGDILLTEVTTAGVGVFEATIRVTGQLARFGAGLGLTLPDERAQTFCDIINSATTPALIDAARVITENTEYGSAIGIARSYGMADVKYYDENLFELSGTPTCVGTAAPTDTDIVSAALAPPDPLTSFDITVNVGDMFYYMSNSGLEFIFAVVEIGPNPSLDPNKQRMTFVYHQI